MLTRFVASSLETGSIQGHGAIYIVRGSDHDSTTNEVCGCSMGHIEKNILT